MSAWFFDSELSTCSFIHQKFIDMPTMSIQFVHLTSPCLNPHDLLHYLELGNSHLTHVGLNNVLCNSL